MLKYKCLVFDHDDTVVNSTPEIHFPAFIKALEKLRPQIKISLEEYTMYSFEPGFFALCTEILKFTKEEGEIQLAIWQDTIKNCIPDYFAGLERIIRRQKDEGGKICVVSHSSSEIIKRDYMTHFGIEPDIVFGGEVGQDKRKPNPYPLREIMRILELQPNELIMVDDLKPGLDMAKACGVQFVYAGWSNTVPRIAQYMRKNSDYYFDTVEDFTRFLD